MPPFDFVDYWLDAVDDAPANSWRPVALRDLDAEVRAHSELWCGDQLSADAAPYLPGRRSRIEASAGKLGTPTSKPTIDLLKHHYEVDDLPVELIEGLNITLLRMTPAKALEGSQKSRIAEIQRLAGLLLSLPCNFQFPPVIGEGVRWSTNPDIGPASLVDWEERIDAGIRSGRLWFLCFRRIPGTADYENDMQWFPDAFRDQLK